jgi:hypothetical protein
MAELLNGDRAQAIEKSLTPETTAPETTAPETTALVPRLAKNVKASIISRRDVVAVAGASGWDNTLSKQDGNRKISMKFTGGIVGDDPAAAVEAMLTSDEVIITVADKDKDSKRGLSSRKVLNSKTDRAAIAQLALAIMDDDGASEEEALALLENYGKPAALPAPTN